jgi:hypothetical protein
MGQLDVRRVIAGGAMAMKAAVKITMIVPGTALLINWVREGARFPLPQVLPFLGGYPS